MSFFYVVIDPYNNIMTSCGLASRKHTTYSKGINYAAVFLSSFERDTFDTILNNLWENLCNLRQDRSIRCLADKELRLKYSRNSWLILASIGMKLRFLLIQDFTHLTNINLSVINIKNKEIYDDR